MADKTRISWTDATWSPARGCSKVSSGCNNCCAEKVAARSFGPGEPYEGTVQDGRWNGQIRLVPEKLSEPLRWNRPRRISVSSMSDMFHDGVPFEYVAAAFGVMAACQQHTFQLLTKRPERALDFFEWVVKQDAATLGRVNFRRAFPDPMTPGRLECCMQALTYEARHHPRGDSGPLHRERAADPSGHWPLPNVHLGVSVEDHETADARIPILLQCPAAVRFVGYQPALGPVDFDDARDWLTPVVTKPNDAPRLDWIIVGGETGQNARPFDVAWARSTIEQCRAAGVACFVSQLGRIPVECFADGPPEPMQLNDKTGADPSEWPADLRVQEFPESAR